MDSCSRFSGMRERRSARKSSTLSTGAPILRYIRRLRRIAAASRLRWILLMITAKRKRRMTRKTRNHVSTEIIDGGSSVSTHEAITTTASTALMQSRR